MRLRLGHYADIIETLIGQVSKAFSEYIEARLEHFLVKCAFRRANNVRERSHVRPGNHTQWFTSTERVLVDALAALIVPGDEESPGAKNADIVNTLDGMVASSESRQYYYGSGLLALDEQARRQYGLSFAKVTLEQQVNLLKQIEHVYEHRSGKLSLRHRIGRKARICYQRWRFPAVAFWPRLVRDVLQAFYTSEASWTWLGYDGPPMPLGYYRFLDRGRPREGPQANIERVTDRSGLDRRLEGSQTEAPCLFNLPPRKKTTDVIVIGCGAGGGVIAKELGEAGLSVVVLEAGKRFTPHTDYKTDELDFEVTAMNVFDFEDERRDRYTCGGRNGFHYNRVKGVGGSTLHYLAMSPRFHESDFRVRSEDGVADDWPISYADLEPYYTRVEYELGVSGPDGADGNPFEPFRSKPFPTPPHEFNCASKVMKRGAERLGLHLVREPVAIPTMDWNGRPACIGAGTCALGCKITSKSSIDVTYVPKAEATGLVEIRSQCMAREIKVGPDRKARSVVFFDATGCEHEVAARAIVLAGNAVETPRLLLLSKSRLFPDGLANSSGLVGKYFTEHLAIFAHGLFSERVDPWRGIPTGGMIQDYYSTDSRNNFKRGWTIVVSNGKQWPLSVARRVSGWGHDHKARTKEMFGHVAGLASIGDQLPDLRNQVNLDPVVRDVFGVPVPRVTNEPRENDSQMLQAISARLRELLLAAGATEAWEDPYSPGASGHYAGTCRMGHDPKTSVVNPWCRTHDVANLFIGDGSVFVTGGAVNPALTISALAVRTAEGIVADFRRGDL